MTKDEIYEAGKVMLAYANGEEIQYKAKGNSTWINATKDFNPKFNWSESDYRVKPKPKYRPFKSAEECWQEMQKHQPFGWVRGTFNKGYVQIQYVMDSDDKDSPVIVHFAPDEEFTGKRSFECYEFADGTPFGIKEQEE